MITRISHKEGQKRLKREDGIVSLWVGRYASQDSLERYLEENYEDFDNDAVLNIFCLEHGFNYYDHDCLECHYFADTNSMREVVSGMEAYFPSITKYFSAKNIQFEFDANFALYLFDYEYFPDQNYVPPIQNERNVLIKFVGTTQYK